MNILPDFDAVIPGTNGVTRRRAIVFFSRFFTRAPVIVIKTLIFGPGIKSARWNRRDWLIVALFQDVMAYPDFSPEPSSQKPVGQKEAAPQVQVIEAQAGASETKGRQRGQKSFFQNQDLPSAKGLSCSRVLIDPDHEYLEGSIHPYSYSSKSGTEECISPVPVKAIWIASSRHDNAVEDYLDLDSLIRSRVKSRLKQNGIPANQTMAIIHFHGGGYISGKELIHSAMSICARTGAYVLYVNYRLAFKTKHTYPAGLQDAVSAYAYLVKVIGIPAQNIGIMGDSAGGGLSLALALYLLDHGLPLPGKLCLLSPWVDLTLGQTTEDTSPFDYIQKRNTHYAGRRYVRRDESLLVEPYASPFWYKWSSLAKTLEGRSWPDTFVLWGACELFAEEDHLLTEKMIHEGGLSSKVIGLSWPDMIHDFTLLPIKEAVKGQRCIADFFLNRRLRGPDSAAL